MRPAAVALDFEPSDSDYDHDLPLYRHDPPYSMSDEKVRLNEDYDDEGKDVYAKVNRNARPYIASGRMPQPPPPPATSIVGLFSCIPCF